MGKINWGRVILGGLLAGVVINISEFVLNGIVLKTRWDEAMKALGKSSEMGGGTMAAWVAYGFVLGVLAAWIYAAVRPRYGPGPKTAIGAGCLVWLLSYALPTIGYLNLQLFPGDMMLISVTWGLVEIIVATLLGGWVYKEA